MLKYYIFLFLIAAGALFYVFLEDPCNKMLRTDFSNKHPAYKILNSGAGEGSPDGVQCHIFYEKPDSDQVYEDIWIYKNTGNGWSFSGVLETREGERTP